VFIDVCDGDVDRACRVLAFAGVRAQPSLETIGPRPGTHAAIGRDLTPLPRDSLALDLVHVRPFAIGPETARLLRAGPLRRPSLAKRTLVRDLLSGVNVSLGWRRRAWATRAVLRTADARRALRPVVFDIAALGAPPERRTLAREGAIARWLFA
jgi:hypothetical protein